MEKPTGLGRLLLEAVPGLAGTPDRLQMFIDKGRILCRGTGTLAFEVAYTLNIVVQDYAGDTSAVFVPVLAWIAEFQPELLDKAGHQPFTFEAEVLDGDAVDLSIDIELSERIGVKARPGGGFDTTHFAEPSRCDDFESVHGVNLWQGFARDLLVVQSAVHAPIAVA